MKRVSRDKDYDRPSSAHLHGPDEGNDGLEVEVGLSAGSTSSRQVFTWQSHADRVYLRITVVRQLSLYKELNG